ncbi:hypothetical protein EV127DRAFT_406057 [Xylaria flabelliformis]|nr:hypothetical protein EV127DRAFT_406057 [Xylaria flabelliformis]
MPYSRRLRNLCLRDEALHSHPTRKGLAREQPQDKGIKKWWRKIAGRLGECQQKRVHFIIPTIRITPPSEEVGQPSSSADSAPETEKDDRRLRHRLKPLESWRTPEAEHVDVTDSVGLKKRSAIVIKDRSDLKKLVPLAQRLCAYLGIRYDLEALDTLPTALDKILSDLKKANYAAADYKRDAKRVKGRILQLEDYIRRLHDEQDEDRKRWADTASHFGCITKDWLETPKVSWC